jgi:hypothetical protein
MGITNASRAVISARLYGTGSAAFVSIGMGTGVTAFAATQTALVTGVKADGTGDGGAHVLATAGVTASSVTITQTNDTAQWTGTTAIPITAIIALTESGVFNNDTNGTMLCRQTFTAVNVVSGDTVNFIWQVQNT